MIPGAPRTSRPKDLRVLVVDDSAVVRQMVSAILSRDPRIEVVVAADPVIAERKIAERRPDVILLDLEMPRMDGLTFLRRLMARDPIPVVVCSAHTERGAEASLRALESGAVGIVTKPKLGVRTFLEESASLLLDAVHSAALARTTRARPAELPPEPPARRSAPRPSGGREVIAIGASIGGPEALRWLLDRLPPETPGLVIVQHMPEIYTEAFARHLDATSRLEVHEARDGDEVRPGRALIAQGNRHLVLVRHGDGYRVRTEDGPLVSRHRPSVDVLFHSVAGSAGRHATGILLTGMGDDGARGLLAMREAGARTIAEDASSCVVFGMPKEAIALGAAARVLPLGRIPGAILDRVG